MMLLELRHQYGDILVPRFEAYLFVYDLALLLCCCLKSEISNIIVKY